MITHINAFVRKQGAIGIFSNLTFPIFPPVDTVEEAKDHWFNTFGNDYESNCFSFVFDGKWVFLGEGKQLGFDPSVPQT